MGAAALRPAGHPSLCGMLQEGARGGVKRSPAQLFPLGHSLLFASENIISQPSNGDLAVLLPAVRAANKPFFDDCPYDVYMVQHLYF